MQASQKRFYKIKGAKTHFICPLCSAERAFRYSSNLSSKNYLQLCITSLLAIVLFYPLMEAKAFVLFFVIWALFEFVNKLNFRKEIPCPHCGFDATWYKKDVRVARKFVEDFWTAKHSEEKSDGQAPEVIVPSQTEQEFEENYLQ